MSTLTCRSSQKSLPISHLPIRMLQINKSLSGCFRLISEGSEAKAFLRKCTVNVKKSSHLWKRVFGQSGYKFYRKWINSTHILLAYLTIILKLPKMIFSIQKLSKFQGFTSNSFSNIFNVIYTSAFQGWKWTLMSDSQLTIQLRFFSRSNIHWPWISPAADHFYLWAILNILSSLFWTGLLNVVNSPEYSRPI